MKITANAKSRIAVCVTAILFCCIMILLWVFLAVCTIIDLKTFDFNMYTGTRVITSDYEKGIADSSFQGILLTADDYVDKLPEIRLAGKIAVIKLPSMTQEEVDEFFIGCADFPRNRLIVCGDYATIKKVGEKDGSVECFLTVRSSLGVSFCGAININCACPISVLKEKSVKKMHEAYHLVAASDVTTQAQLETCRAMCVDLAFVDPFF